MDTAPEAAGIRRMNAADPGPMRELLFEFLRGWPGGARALFPEAEPQMHQVAHRPFAIGEAERDEWMLCMRRAMEDCGVQKEARGLLDKPRLRMAEAFRYR